MVSKNTFKNIYTFLFPPLKKSNKKFKNKKLFQEVKQIFFILLFTFIFLFLWANRVKLYPDNIWLWMEGAALSFSGGKGYPIKIDGEKIAAENVKLMGGNIAALSDNSFTALNSSAKIIRSEKHNFSNPALKLNGIRAMIYDIGGKNFKIESLARTLYKGCTEEKIISAAIAETGVYGLVTESKNYLSEMTVFRKDNAQKYRYYFSDHFVTDLALTSSGDAAAACGISLKEGKTSSKIYIFDLKSETPQAAIELEDNFVHYINYLSSGKLMVIGDKYTSVINIKSHKTQNFSYDGKILKCYDFDKDKGICMCLAPSLNEAHSDEIVHMNSGGKATSIIKTNESFSSISFNNSRIAGLTHNKIISFSYSGNSEGYIDTKSNSKKIMLAPHSAAYILNFNMIEKIMLTNLKSN